MARRPRARGGRGSSRQPRPADDVLKGPIRLNRYIARSGVCSRRDADVLIKEGRVRVNGDVVTAMGTKVEPGDRVEVNGALVSPRDHVYLLLNKPGDTITTTDDERDRQTVLDLVALPDEEKAGLFPVGRLDRHTLGVLLLTNDGDLAHRLMHPRYEIDKVYLVETRQPVKPHELEQLAEGVELDDGPARFDEIAYPDPQQPTVVGVRLHEGRNRQVRRMFEAVGHEAVKLERIRYAGLTTQGIRRGKWRRLFPHEVKKLRRAVGLK